MLSLLATALTRSHPAFATTVKNELRVSVPIMLREPGSVEEGNLTAAVMVDVPLADTPADVRLDWIRQRSARLLTPTRALASRFVMARVLRMLPSPAQRWFARTVYGPAFVQTIVTNMPGPTQKMTIADVPLDEVFPILPLAPGTPLAVGALSWNGVFGVGLAADPQFLDVDTVAAAMSDALRELIDGEATRTA